MYQYARPKIAIPVHGELRHMIEHANLARDCQVSHVVVVENGALVRLAAGKAGGGCLQPGLILVGVGP